MSRYTLWSKTCRLLLLVLLLLLEAWRAPQYAQTAALPALLLMRAALGAHRSPLGTGATRGVSARTLSASLVPASGLLLQQDDAEHSNGSQACAAQAMHSAKACRTPIRKVQCQRAAAHVFFAAGRLSMCPIGSHSRSHTSAVRMAVAA